MTVRTESKRAEDIILMYTKADFITAVITGSEMADNDATARQSRVDELTQELALLVALTDWDSEENIAVFPPIVTLGNNYVAE